VPVRPPVEHLRHRWDLPELPVEMGVHLLSGLPPVVAALRLVCKIIAPASRTLGLVEQTLFNGVLKRAAPSFTSIENS